MIRLTGLIDLSERQVWANDEADPEEADNFDDGPGIDDHEAPMAKAQLLSIHKQSSALYNMIGDDEELEGWVQDKLSKAADYINSVYRNMEYEKTNATSLGSGEGTPADGTLSPRN